MGVMSSYKSLLFPFREFKPFRDAPLSRERAFRNCTTEAARRGLFHKSLAPISVSKGNG